jgi:hypothetical protein
MERQEEEAALKALLAPLGLGIKEVRVSALLPSGLRVGELQGVLQGVSASVCHAHLHTHVVG